MCSAYEITCFDLSKNICMEHIIYLIFKKFKYIKNLSMEAYSLYITMQRIVKTMENSK
jgi:hypothetical protein